MNFDNCEQNSEEKHDSDTIPLSKSTRKYVTRQSNKELSANKSSANDTLIWKSNKKKICVKAKNIKMNKKC